MGLHQRDMELSIHSVVRVTVELAERRGRADCHDHDSWDLRIEYRRDDGTPGAVLAHLYSEADRDIGLEGLAIRGAR